MTTFILPKTENIGILTPDKLADIAKLLAGVSDYQISSQREERRSGQYVKVKTDDGMLHYVCYSSYNDSRNTRLTQPFPPAFNAYLQDPVKHKQFSVYIVAKDGIDRTDTLKFIYRCLATAKVKVLNYADMFAGPLRPFASYEDFREQKLKLSAHNTGNKPSYVTDGATQISIFGKVDGVNARESFILALTVKALTEKRVVVYPRYKKPTDNFTKSEQTTLEQFGIVIGERFPSDSAIHAEVNLKESDRELRNQPAFWLNLLDKYGENKRCYLCGCNIERLIIASHIERVADIKRSTDYADEEKRRRVIDGDNGLWLCANHDKMFEHGLIYFDDVGKLVVNKIVADETQRDFIAESIFATRDTNADLDGVVATGADGKLEFLINPDHLTDNMKAYLACHRQRVS